MLEPQGPPLTRLPLHSVLLGLYVLTGLAMAFLAWRPTTVLADASDTKVATLRTLFAVAAAACLAIAVGGFRHEPWARGIALTVHALAAAVATVGLVALLCGRPVLGEHLGELAVKAAIHGLLAWLWAGAWMRQWFAP